MVEKPNNPDKFPSEGGEKTENGSVELPIMITLDMEKKLINKGLTQAEINKLTPESANFLIEENFTERENYASKDQKVEVINNNETVEYVLTEAERAILMPNKKEFPKPNIKPVEWPKKMTREEIEKLKKEPNVSSAENNNESVVNAEKPVEKFVPKPGDLIKWTNDPRPMKVVGISEDGKLIVDKTHILIPINEVESAEIVIDKTNNKSEQEEKPKANEELISKTILAGATLGNPEKPSEPKKEKPENGPGKNPPDNNKLEGGAGSKPPKNNKEKNSERYGFKDVSFKNNLAKGAIDTIGSVFGARLAWELPKLIFDDFKKTGAKNSTLELLNTVRENNINKNIAIKLKELNEKFKAGGTKEELGKIEEERDKLQKEWKETSWPESKGNGTESLPVREKIASFNEKLKNVKLPESEKKELRDQMAKVLWEHRHSTEEIDKNRADKVGKVFDVYANDSVQRMTVAREAVNTASIFLMIPWLRGVGYTALAGAGSVAKVSNEFDKKHFNEEKINSKEKLSYIAKAMTVDSAKETYNSLIGNFIDKNEKGEKMSFGKALTGSISKAFSLGFGVARLAGVAEFEHALQSGNLVMTEGGTKIIEALKSGSIGEFLKQGGQNWINNAERLLSSIHMPVKSVNTSAEMDKIKELATIHKGEGVIHTFQRQIEHNPKAFGFTGDEHNQIALHKFASQKAYGIALEDGYVKPDGSEVRIAYDAKNPEQFILNSTNQKVEEINTQGHEYSFNSEKTNIDEINRTLAVKSHIEDIYKSDSILPSQYEEWGRVKHLKANDFIAGHFGTPVNDLDMIEAQDRIQLQDYLKELKSKFNIIPGSNESTEAFILRANNIHSLNAESLPGFKEFKEHIDKIQGIKQRIEDIYKFGFGPFQGSQIEELKTVGGLKTLDFIAGKNIPTIGNQLDAVELGDRQKMQDYLKELLKKSHLVAKNNETVAAFIARANKISLKDLKDMFNIKA